MRILNIEELPEFVAGEEIRGPSGEWLQVHGRVFCRPWLIETNPENGPRWYYGALRLPDKLFLQLDDCKDCKGHEDAESARLSFKRHIFDEHFHFDRSTMPHKCSICADMTRTVAIIFFWYDWPPLPLCQKHLTLATAFDAFTIADHELTQVSELKAPIMATMTRDRGPISLTNLRAWGTNP
jgi:hypothetical protein